MILYFTGTGNSRYAARRIAARLGDEAVSMTESMQSGESAAFDSEKPYVFVMPTYAWRMPRIARSWIERASLSGSTQAYFVLTCGSDVGNAAADAEKLCASKGLTFRGLLGIAMPENYVAMFPVPDAAEAAEIIRRAEPAIDAAADTVLRGDSFPESAPSVADRIKSGAGNRAFYAAAVRDRSFFATDACTGCGRCASLCPLQNITLADGRPVWHGSCTHCMACICSCPAEAIEYGKSSVGKPRYRLE